MVWNTLDVENVVRNLATYWHNNIVWLGIGGGGGGGGVVLLLLLLYAVAEALFACLTYFYWLPKLNAPRQPPTVRNLEHLEQRHKLFERMLLRQESLCEALDIPVASYFTQFIRNWFFVLPDDDDINDKNKSNGDHDDDDDDGDNNNNSSSSGSKKKNNSNEEEEDDGVVCIKETGLPCKEDLDRLISWGYFHAHVENMTEDWQQRELAKMYELIEKRHHMKPGPKTKQKLKAVQMTLEPLDIKYRPLIIYILAFLGRAFFSAILYWKGFSHHVASTGLPYWYRPNKKQSSATTATSNPADTEPLPFLVFHGIAPCGPSFYVPMIVWGLATNENTEIDRPIFFFENPAVSFSLTDHAPTEQETVDGVWEAVDKHCSSTTQVSTIGHSFGTCLQTYLIHSKQAHRVKQMVLVDPVSIILSDPDVITNFVYGRSHFRNNKLHDSVPNPGAAGFVMNELFVEHFLRRQFAWYNGELFFEDIPDYCKLIVCLSDADQICNSQKVKAHIDIYNGETPEIPRCMKYLKQDSSTETATTNTDSSARSSRDSSSGSSSSRALGGSKNKIEVVYWHDLGHGSCLFDTKAWRQLKQAMRKQELKIIKEKSQ